MKSLPDEKKPTGKRPELSRTDQARDVIEEYANHLRAIITKPRRHLS